MEKWQVYIQEALSQVEFAKRCYALYRKALERRSDVTEIFLQVHHFVVHASNIDKIIDAKPGSDRATILGNCIDFTGVNLKPFRRLRNHLEHFDERLDMWVANYDGHAFLDMNLVTGSKGFPKKAFLRALDGDAFKFHGEDYSLTELYTEILKIEKLLSEAEKHVS
ncbi:hypothetical protein EPO44_19425 [bacterium]|nr:MAG: hypothetical protein EPO44_19425 [bacterium]